MTSLRYWNEIERAEPDRREFPRPATYPPPLVSFKEHKAKFLWQKLKTVLPVLIATHICTLAVVTAYYLLTQVLHGQHVTILGLHVHLWNIKYGWDHLFSSIVPIMSVTAWNGNRHLVRNVMEGVYGGFGAQYAAWNDYKKIGPVRWFDRLEMRLHILNLHQDRETITSKQIVGAVALAFLVYPWFGFALGWVILQGLHHLLNVGALGTHGKNFVEELYSNNADQKIVGFLASLVFGRRPLRPVYSWMQEYFAERHEALRDYHKKLPLWFRALLLPATFMRWIVGLLTPPPMKARIREVHDNPQEASDLLGKRSWWVGWTLSVIVLATIVMAYFGQVILRTGHL